MIDNVIKCCVNLYHWEVLPLSKTFWKSLNNNVLMNLNYIPYQLSDNQTKLTMSILELVQSSDKNMLFINCKDLCT